MSLMEHMHLWPCNYVILMGFFSCYEGEVLNGIRHGYGTMNYANGMNYVGDWIRGKQSGKVEDHFDYSVLKKNCLTSYDRFQDFFIDDTTIIMPRALLTNIWHTCPKWHVRRLCVACVVSWLWGKKSHSSCESTEIFKCA